MAIADFSFRVLTVAVSIDGEKVAGLDIPFESGINLTPERFQAEIVQAFADWIRVKNLGPDGTES